MGIKVAKFGGSSVADALQIGKIKRIIENDIDIKYALELIYFEWSVSWLYSRLCQDGMMC